LSIWRWIWIRRGRLEYMDKLIQPEGWGVWRQRKNFDALDILAINKLDVLL